MATSAMPAASERRSGPAPRRSRLGWSAMKAMAQKSWKMRMPKVRRPERVAISSLSKSSLTTMSVEDNESAMAR